MKCPHCNEEIKLTPLQQLKAHIKTRIKQEKSWIARCKRHNPDYTGRADILAKWESWKKAIEDLENKQ